MASLVRSTDVARPLRQVYDAWSRLEDLPAILPGVASVRRLDERSTHWVVAIAREQREFGATIVEQVPDTRIVWESRGGTPDHEGAVSFRPLAGDRTRVTVELTWQPAGLFDRIGDRLGLVGRRVEGDLDAFRRHVEASGPAEGDRTTIGHGSDPGHSDAAEGVVDAAAALVDDHRGRTADSPLEVPVRGWVEIVKRTVRQVKSDNVPVVAAGVAFYVFLALIPALLAVILIYGIVADPADVQRQLDDSLGALPREAQQLVRTQLTEVTEQEETGLGLGLAVSVVAAVLSASRGISGLIVALNVAYDEEETRKFVRLRLITYGLTLAVAVGAAAGTGAMVVVANVAERLGRGGEIALVVLRWPILGAFVALGLAALYRYAPDRDRAQWRWVTPGAVVATVLWLLGSVGFSIYVRVAGSFTETYGTLAGTVLLLLWLFVTAYIVVFGAELDSEAERQTARDSTAGPRKPLGQRRAYAADTVAS
ncbi:MAG: YihY family inner membrane protein [Acidimicrobiia bacterium]|nr:YihY family inner membrane protein [Acidimicrobiia bacterium]